MKRIVLLVVLLILQLSFIGCDDSGDETNPPPEYFQVYPEEDCLAAGESIHYMITDESGVEYSSIDLKINSYDVTSSVVIDSADGATSVEVLLLLDWSEYTMDDFLWFCIESNDLDGNMSEHCDSIAVCPTEEIINPATALVLTATTNGLGVNLAWTGSTTEDIDGYKVYFNGTIIVDDVTTTSYQHTNPGRLGDYEVVAVRDDEESDPATASSELVEGTSNSIYWMSDPSPDHPSGFGWSKFDGSAIEYTLSAANHPYIHIVLDSEMDIISPHIELSGVDINNTFFDFIPEGYSSITQAGPCHGEYFDYYGTYIDGEVGEAAVVALPDGSDYYYCKMEVTSVNDTDHSITIRWGFQLIPDLRLLD